MYVRSVNIQNIKLLRDVKISFLRGDEPRMWTVLVGENGLCKTTILQAIAMAASGRDRANQLANVPSLQDRRRANNPAFVGAEFVFAFERVLRREYPKVAANSDTPQHLITHVHVFPDSAVVTSNSHYQPLDTNQPLDVLGLDPNEQRDRIYDFVSSDALTLARAKNLSGWFVAGYGVERKLPEPDNAPRMTDPAFQRMAPLFGKGPMLATGFADIFNDTEQTLGFVRELRRA